MAASSRVPGVIRTARILGIFQTGVMITAIVGLIIDTVAQRRGTGEEARVGDAFMCHSPTLGQARVPSLSFQGSASQLSPLSGPAMWRWPR